MSARNFDLSYVANAQMALLGPLEKAELKELFAGSLAESSGVTKATADGRFVSRAGTKRVLWRRGHEGRPEILSIVDESFARTK